MRVPGGNLVSGSRDNFLRATRGKPCPVCEKPDWCLVARDGSVAICARVKSSRPIQRPGRDQAGYLHVLDRNARAHVEALPIVKRPLLGTDHDWTKLAASFASALTNDKLTTFATSLGLSAESLRRLSVGWSAWQRAYSFPMRDAGGEIVGIRLRKPTGFKYCVTGSRSALFIPERLESATTLCIAEGPTDCAALLDLGLAAVGRPSCTGGIALLLRLVNQLHPSHVVIVADADQPGQVGARSLANAVSVLTVGLRIVTPPSGIKDVRDWKRQITSAEEILTAPAFVYPHPAIRRAQRHAVEHRANARRRGR